MVIASPAAIAAARAYDFVSTLGINTHIDFANYGYQNLATVESSINYLGVKNIRDSAETATDAQTWLQVSQATGAKFDDYIAETSPAGMSVGLSYVKQLAAEGILNFIEGGNEEDDAYPAVPRKHTANHRAVSAAGLRGRPGAWPAGHQYEFRFGLDAREQLPGQLCRRGRPVGVRRLWQCPFVSQCRTRH